MWTCGAGEAMGKDVHPDGLGSVCQGLRWRIPHEYRAHQWLSLAAGFGG